MPSNESDLSDLSAWNIIVGRVVGRWDRTMLKVAAFSEVPDRFGLGKEIAVDWQGGKRRLTIQASDFKAGSFFLACGLTQEEADALRAQLAGAEAAL